MTPASDAEKISHPFQIRKTARMRRSCDGGLRQLGVSVTCLSFRVLVADGYGCRCERASKNCFSLVARLSGSSTTSVDELKV